MRLAALCVALALPIPAAARHRHAPRQPPATVILDGAPMRVRWTDGDTFRVVDGTLRGLSARLAGYDTL
jgi:endonuclease YncB( thermonuclease family)